MTGNAKMTFSPVLAGVLFRMRFGRDAARNHGGLVISHPKVLSRGVTPPLTMTSEKNPRARAETLHPRAAPTSSRVPNTNSRSGGFTGVLIRCLALMSAISASVGNRLRRSSTIRSRNSRKQAPLRCRALAASRSHVSITLHAVSFFALYPEEDYGNNAAGK